MPCLPRKGSFLIIQFTDSDACAVLRPQIPCECRWKDSLGPLRTGHGWCPLPGPTLTEGLALPTASKSNLKKITLTLFFTTPARFNCKTDSAVPIFFSGAWILRHLLHNCKCISITCTQIPKFQNYFPSTMFITKKHVASESCCLFRDFFPQNFFFRLWLRTGVTNVLGWVCAFKPRYVDAGLGAKINSNALNPTSLFS